MQYPIISLFLCALVVSHGKHILKKLSQQYFQKHSSFYFIAYCTCTTGKPGLSGAVGANGAASGLNLGGTGGGGGNGGACYGPYNGGNGGDGMFDK
jgi:hypothetical protein